MTLKTWVLGRVHKSGSVLGRGDLPRREPTPATLGDKGERAKPERPVPGAEHLGLYGALVGAIREELEHFVASHVRLHLAIADRDRFVLTSIHVSCPDDEHARELLQQFMHEFKPEQVKRYLAREVIAALPNAAAIDLSQFAGLLDADSQHEPEDDNDYGELLAALRTTPETPSARAYRVSIMGRWTEHDGALRAAATAQASSSEAPATPLAGARCDFDIEDAEGRRRVVLHGIVPGRRYLVGKDAGCDIRVNGSYTSRRHAELWMEQGAWHVGDAGSTNGLRVEAGHGAVERAAPAAGGARAAGIRLNGGERIVLSAHAEGATSDYPAIALRTAAPDLAARVTPIASAVSSSTPSTPLTPLRAASQDYTLQAQGASGTRTLTVTAESLPLSVGRSRNQSLVIGRAHELVSGHHLDIVSIEPHGVQVVVHGDNGVQVDGLPYPVGARFLWKPGQAMLLGAPQADGRACTLTLSRQA